MLYELPVFEHADAESVQAQVITYPCIVIGVEAGEFRDVRALDQDGELLGEVRI